MAEQHRKSFYTVVTEALKYFTEHGFVSSEKLEFWTRELRAAAERSMIPPLVMEENLRATFGSIYRRMVERGGIAKYHPGVGRFTLQQVSPRLRAELNRRILASASLIKLNRAEAVEKTIRRFSGWATSIPAGGSETVDKRETKDDVRKALASLPFETRRVHIDQGHKFVANLNNIIATDGGAIAGRWVDRGTSDAHYKARPQHKAWSDRKAVFLVRDSWAHKAGLVKPNDDGFTDDHEAPSELVYCFPGSTRVPFADGVEVAYRRWYSGDLAEFVTASGKTISATPNHPILTPNGWIAAGLLKEGDYVIEVADDSVFFPEKDEDIAEPMISEIFSSVAESGISQVIRGEFEQFHGDGSDGNIDIVFAARPLLFGKKSLCDQRASKGVFAMPFHSRLRAGALELFWKKCDAVATSLVRSFRDVLSFFCGHRSHPQNGRLVVAANCLARQDEAPFNSSSGNTKIGGQRKDAFPVPITAQHIFGVDLDTRTSPINLGTEVESAARMASVQNAGTYSKDARDLVDRLPFRTKAERVVAIKRRWFSSHVYNLQAKDGVYVAQGIVASNCSCHYVFLYNLRQLPPEMLTAKGKEALERAKISA